jgi:hypothetical protein
MRRNHYPLRLQPSLMEEARKVAESEGVALNQLFNVAVAEKLAALRTESRFQEQIRHAARVGTPRSLDRAGKRNLPMESEKLSPDRSPDGEPAVKVFGWATPQFGKLKKHLDKISRTWRQR